MWDIVNSKKRWLWSCRRSWKSECFSVVELTSFVFKEGCLVFYFKLTAVQSCSTHSSWTMEWLSFRYLPIFSKRLLLKSSVEGRRCSILGDVREETGRITGGKTWGRRNLVGSGKWQPEMTRQTLSPLTKSRECSQKLGTLCV